MPRLRTTYAALLAVLVTAGIVATDHIQCSRRTAVQRVPEKKSSAVAAAPTRSVAANEPTSPANALVTQENAPPANEIAAALLDDDAVVKIRELAEADPVAVAEAALRENTGALRARLLLEALPLWADRDPASAAEWLTARAPARELDLGLLALARHRAFVAKMPAAAFSLACEIVDPSLRISAQRSIVQDWMPRDASRIRGIVEHTRDLTPSDRALLLSELDGLLAAR